MHGARVLGRLVLAAVLLLGGAAACSDDDGDDGATESSIELETTMPTGDPAAVDVIAGDLLETAEDPNALPVDEESARCIAERVVLGFEPERLEELGLDVEAGTGVTLAEPPLSEEEADAAFGIFGSCIDLIAELAAVFAEDGVDATCAAEHYRDSGLLREALFSPDYDEALNTRIDAALDEAFTTCAE